MAVKALIKKALNWWGYELKKIPSSAEERAMYVDLFGRESVKKKRFYTISAGGHFEFGGAISHPFWTSIDVDRPWKTGRRFNPSLDIAHDLLSVQPIPVESNSAELVYSGLCIEHITDEAALFMFKEVERILKKGGIIRIVAPDVDLDYRAFCNNDVYFFSWMPRGVSIEQSFLLHFAGHASTHFKGNSSPGISDAEFRNLFERMTFVDAMNYCTSRCRVEIQKEQRACHINWWTTDKLTRFLNDAGFRSVAVSAAGQSASPALRNNCHFDNKFIQYMLFVEAIK
jgi:SAM-dependent methyltransferase